MILYPYMRRKKYLCVDKAHCVSVWVLEACIVILIVCVVMLAVHSLGEREEQGLRVRSGGWLG